MSYDSTQDTLSHIVLVGEKIDTFRHELAMRAMVHNRSKLESPEKEIFDKYTPILKTLTYGSDEYKANLANLKPALDHHYANNSHHPEHYPDGGIDHMNLFDIVEMFCDWIAATERTKDGDMCKSIQINSNRFEMTPQLTQIFINTLKHYGL